MTNLKKPAGNRRLAKVAVQCSADTFVVNQSLVLRINICGENRHLRQAPKRCDEIPSGFRHIARRLCRPKPFQGLRTSEGFAKCKTLRKASGRCASLY